MGDAISSIWPVSLAPGSCSDLGSPGEDGRETWTLSISARRLVRSRARRGLRRSVLCPDKCRGPWRAGRIIYPPAGHRAVGVDVITD